MFETFDNIKKMLLSIAFHVHPEVLKFFSSVFSIHLQSNQHIKLYRKYFRVIPRFYKEIQSPTSVKQDQSTKYVKLDFLCLKLVYFHQFVLRSRHMRRCQTFYCRQTSFGLAVV